MNFTNMLRVASIAVILAVSSGATYAGGTPQTHHCKLPDGTMDMSKTKKQCHTSKGTWAKDAAAAAAPAAPAPAAAATTPGTQAAPAAAAPAPKN